MPSTSSAAKPATDQLQPSPIALESTTLTLADVFTKLLECRRSFKGESSLCPHEDNFSNAAAQQLLQDIPVLQEWQRVTHPSHKVRDAMMKLASNWKVTQKAKGKKRSPCEVARDIEENMLKKAKLVLTNNVSKSSTQSENNFDEAATQTQASQSSTAKPVLNQLHFVTTPTMSSSSTMQSLL